MIHSGEDRRQNGSSVKKKKNRKTAQKRYLTRKL